MPANASGKRRLGRTKAGAKSPALIDLFAGAGGFTLGFVQAGFRPVFAVEQDRDAAATYVQGFGPHCHVGDIQHLEEFPTADVIIGGPPCQGFSKLGARLPNDPRNQLWRHFMRAVRKVEPKVFVIENVPQLLKSEEGEEIKREAERLGYKVEGRVLNSADYGAPQLRKRAFIIGCRAGPVRFPQATHRDPRKCDMLSEALPAWETLRKAIGDLPFEPTGDSLHFGRNPTAKSLERYRHVRPGGNRLDLPVELMPPCWVNRKTGRLDVFGRLNWNAPAVTIRTEFFKPEKGRYLHPEAHRPITHREAARIQGFPDDFEFSGSKIEIARQIGNAVPIPLGYAIAVAVREMLEGGASETKMGGRHERRL